MDRSHAQYDEVLHEQATVNVQRSNELRSQAASRSRSRRAERVRKQGTLRFIGLCVVILATTVIVTFAMFQALAAVAG